MTGNGQLIKGARRGRQAAVSGILSFCREQIANAGEDAALSLIDEKSGACLIACLDGCGGAGAKRYPEADNWTGARLSAYLSGDCLCRWFDEACTTPSALGAEAAPRELEARLKTTLGEARSRLESEGASLIRGRLTKPLPSTLSAALITRANEGTDCLFLWAGDSRGYVLGGGGLVQLTVDDVTNPDPFDNLRGDGVLTNMLTANLDFTLHARAVRLPSRSIVIVATDGCFAYYASPVELEGILLDTLAEATTPIDWERRLSERIGAFASDDHTMVLALAGFSDFSDVKRELDGRRRFFTKTYGAPTAKAKLEGNTEALREIWLDYMKDYYR